MSEIFAHSSGDWQRFFQLVPPSGAGFHGTPTTTGTPSAEA